MEKSREGTVAIRQATSGDVAEIRKLLRLSDLPSDDIEEHLPTFLVAVAGGEVVGAVGLEVNGTSGLLRSLVVAERLRGSGLGKRLYAGIVDKADSLGIQKLGLLTTTAEGFFAKAGFIREDRSGVPEFIASSKEYLVYCPSTAVIMTKTIR